MVLAGVLLGQAAVNGGFYAAGSNSYGAQARGSACKAEVVLDTEPIDYPHVESPDVFVAMSQGAYDSFSAQTARGGTILFDTGMVKSEGGPDEKGVDVTAVAMKELENKQAANVVWVGIVAGLTGWFDKENLMKAVEQYVPKRFLALNRKALDRGFELGRALRGE